MAVETQLFSERDAAQVRSDLLDCQVSAVHIIIKTAYIQCACDTVMPCLSCRAY